MPKFEDYLETNDALFHFTSAKVAIENILFEGSLRFSPYSRMNDPNEYRYQDIYDSWSFGSLLQDNGFSKASVVEILEHIIRFNSKVCCFCQSNEKLPGYYKPRMWAQYSDNNEGVCLVFSKEKLLYYIKNHLKYKYLFSDYVAYKGEIPRSRYMIHQNISNSVNYEDDAITHLHNNKNNIYFLKHTDFEQENEFRIILIKENDDINYLTIPIKDFIKGIIIGDRFHDSFVDIINHLSGKLKMEARRFRFHKGKYDLFNCTRISNR
ncbi:MAG: DUF2971 domain-containing protein [Candidatus Marinimicrobia bacterium]|nr:DUF2971 domain-containing protein [Candidatus Neomarinimicrobiota bacterium]